MKKNATAQILFITLCVLTAFPFVSSAVGLFLGLAFALVIGNPFPEQSKKWTPRLLQISVVGLGAQMHLSEVAKAGLHGIGVTFVGIIVTLAFGMLLAKVMRVEKETSLLVSVGTAICGGSAIAAVAPTIKAKAESVSIALATVFALNSVALFIFPPIGHWLGLNEYQFGIWSALAIHDTSSVVGASLQYGVEAQKIATTVKLARALWIVPLTFGIGLLYRSKGKAKKPWFILGFLGMAALVTYVPELSHTGSLVAMLARRSLVVTLFLIGSSLSKKALQTVGVRPLLLGILLWIFAGMVSLLAIKVNWI